MQLFAPSTLQKTQVVSYDRSGVSMAPRGQIWGHPGPESTELVQRRTTEMSALCSEDYSLHTCSEAQLRLNLFFEHQKCH